MISMVMFLLLLGLIVFGPKKTIEFAQEIGRLVAHAKQAVGQLQESVLAENRTAVTAAAPSVSAVEPKKF
jgi:Sec-independent protein translocase protein TatA